jgi:phosphoenolpyruvate carboxykinase (ATP)
MTQNNQMIYHNLTPSQLAEAALANQEVVLSSNGALCVATGTRTGRSPKDRYIVRDAVTDRTVDWGKVNQPISTDIFQRLWQKGEDFLNTRPHYRSQFTVGADPHYGLPVTVMTELAWHALFASHLFIHDPGEQKNREKNSASSWTILNVPSVKTDPQRDGVNSDAALILNFSERKILLLGLRYAGEMKKAMFTVMNFLLPPQGVLPMHCAANQGEAGDTALFFGLSGTGKTTLSADPERYLIGDDEHGWSPLRIFNFEGGCYAKCIKLSQEKEPMIWHAIRDYAIMENVVLDAAGLPNYDDTSLTENTRAAYPLDYIEQRVPQNSGPVPKHVIFLTCDLYGVLPPVATLSLEQAAYYFLSGYTALVASTEVGQAPGVSPTFSTCFGAPFFPRHPSEYAALLMERVNAAGASVYLVNTGWTGGRYGAGGERFSIPQTRAIIRAILHGDVAKAKTQILPIFNLHIPLALAGIETSLLETKILDPRQTWSDPKAYQEAARELAARFVDNFQRFNTASMDSRIIHAGPKPDVD